MNFPSLSSQIAGHCERFSVDDCALNSKRSRCRSVWKGDGDGNCICSEHGICVKMTTVQGLRAKLQRMERELLKSRELYRQRTGMSVPRKVRPKSKKIKTD